MAVLGAHGVATFFAEAPAHLKPRGSLVIVVLRRVPVEEWLSAAFSRVESRVRDNLYEVWLASGPKKAATKPSVRLRPRQV